MRGTMSGHNERHNEGQRGGNKRAVRGLQRKAAVLEKA